MIIVAETGWKFDTRHSIINMIEFKHKFVAKTIQSCIVLYYFVSSIVGHLYDSGVISNF
jgi:hypothetical protein